MNKLLLRLLQIPRFGVKTIHHILENANLQDLRTYEDATLRHIGWQDDQILAWRKSDSQLVENAMKWAEQPRHYLINIFDKNYPYMLKQIANPPVLLFIKGNPATLDRKQIAIVGSRHCSSYGEYWAKYFAQNLSRKGFVITSGLALGIDSICHRAVLDIQGETIAVLGSGLEDIYPRKHRKLAENILQHQGVLVSEFLPNEPPIARHFPQRNRIVSGLSQGVLVVEASEKSGSLITANFALEQNRDVFAIPGQIQSHFSHGCHKLIRQGATLVEKVEDILDALSPHQQPSLFSTPPKPRFPPLSTKSERPLKALPTAKHPALFQLIGYQPISLDELHNHTKLSFDILLIQLLDLELQDLIVKEEGLYRRT